MLCMFVRLNVPQLREISNIKLGPSVACIRIVPAHQRHVPLKWRVVKAMVTLCAN